MAPARQVNLLNEACAAYIAGLVDGEGTITLSRVHANEKRRLVVSISNNEIDIVTFVVEAVGVGKITRKRTYQPHHAASYAFQISGRQALALLQQVAPYLRSYKLRRARLVLEHYVALTPRNGKYSAEGMAARQEFEAKLLAIRP